MLRYLAGRIKGARDFQRGYRRAAAAWGVAVRLALSLAVLIHCLILIVAALGRFFLYLMRKVWLGHQACSDVNHGMRMGSKSVCTQVHVSRCSLQLG